MHLLKGSNPIKCKRVTLVALQGKLVVMKVTVVLFSGFPPVPTVAPRKTSALRKIFRFGKNWPLLLSLADPFVLHSETRSLERARYEFAAFLLGNTPDPSLLSSLATASDSNALRQWRIDIVSYIKLKSVWAITLTFRQKCIVSNELFNFTRGNLLIFAYDVKR